MLKKGHLVNFTRPMSSMHLVFECVQSGENNIHTIMKITGRRKGQVTSALYNLAFIGAIVSVTDAQGRRRYELPPVERPHVAQCLCGVRSIFDVS